MAEESAQEVEDEKEAAKRVSELKGKIKALGNVNMDAIEEFKKAMDLVKVCNDKLNDAEESIAKIVKDNGELIEFNASQ